MAWDQACSEGGALVVPENRVYHLKPIKFSGPCHPNTSFKVRYYDQDPWFSNDVLFHVPLMKLCHVN